jgi:hypothetical protein
MLRAFLLVTPERREQPRSTRLDRCLRTEANVRASGPALPLGTNHERTDCGLVHARCARRNGSARPGGPQTRSSSKSGASGENQGRSPTPRKPGQIRAKHGASGLVASSFGLISRRTLDAPGRSSPLEAPGAAARQHSATDVAGSSLLPTTCHPATCLLQPDSDAYDRPSPHPLPRWSLRALLRLAI